MSDSEMLPADMLQPEQLQYTNESIKAEKEPECPVQHAKVFFGKQFLLNRFFYSSGSCKPTLQITNVRPAAEYCRIDTG